MKKILASLFLGGAVVLAIGLAPADSAGPVLKSGSNCVAYKTSKTLAIISSSDIVGTNCNVAVKAVKTSNGELGAEITVPISAFNSHEPDRDVAVAKLLKSGPQPNLIIRTESMTAAEWLAMLKRGSGTVKGQMQFGGSSYPVSTNAKVRKSGNQVEVSGIIVTKFSSFGIKPPVVGPGGIIAKAPDHLELHYNFLSGKVQNLSIVPMK